MKNIILILLFLNFISCGVQIKDSIASNSKKPTPSLSLLEMAQSCANDGSVQNMLEYQWTGGSTAQFGINSIVSPLEVILDFTGALSTGTTVNGELIYHGSAGDVVVFNISQAFPISIAGWTNVDFAALGISPSPGDSFTINFDVDIHALIDGTAKTMAYTESVTFPIVAEPSGLSQFALGTVRPFSSDVPYCPPYYRSMYTINNDAAFFYPTVSPFDKYFQGMSSSTAPSGYTITSKKITITREADNFSILNTDVDGFEVVGAYAAVSGDTSLKITTDGWYTVTMDIGLDVDFGSGVKSTSNSTTYRFELRPDGIIYDEAGKRLFELGMGYTEWRLGDVVLIP